MSNRGTPLFIDYFLEAVLIYSILKMRSIVIEFYITIFSFNSKKTYDLLSEITSNKAVSI